MRQSLTVLLLREVKVLVTKVGICPPLPAPPHTHITKQFSNTSWVSYSSAPILTLPGNSIRSHGLRSQSYKTPSPSPTSDDS